MQALSDKQPLPPLVVITSSEPLLILEASDKVRDRARNEGFTEQHRFTMDSRSDWQPVFAAGSSGSLFGDRTLIELALPSAKPGKAGGDALIKIAEQTAGTNVAQDVMTVIKLPGLDKATRETRWAKALFSTGQVLELPEIARHALPEWISARLGIQGQSMQRESLGWLADRVEGNLLAAHQEIQKLGLLYPAGEISQQQCQAAVLNVARYDVFDLRDAMLEGDARRMLRVLWGLKAEGEALPLVLWAVGEEIRSLAHIQHMAQNGHDLSNALRAQRIFGVREQRARQALRRVNPKRWPRAVAHAHDIDRLIKGLTVKGRLADPWHEMARLALSIASGRTR